MPSITIDTDKLCAPPEVCGADVENSKHEHLLKHTTGARDGLLKEFLKRDKPLLLAIMAMVVVMNLPKPVSHILYPFQIFSTWVHEMCHGIAAILVGGGIEKLLIYPDTSGMAWTYTDGTSWKRGFVSSAGYTGTAVLGMILLLFRRTYRGPTYGTIGLGILIILSCAIYVRNTFALVMLPFIAVVFILCAWKLKARHLTYLYSFLAATCSFNAVDNISELFGSTGYVNGQEATSDAHTVAEHWGGYSTTWASLWLASALTCSALGLLLAFDGVTFNKGQHQQQATCDIESPGEYATVATVVQASAPPLAWQPAAAPPVVAPELKVSQVAASSVVATPVHVQLAKKVPDDRETVVVY